MHQQCVLEPETAIEMKDSGNSNTNSPKSQNSQSALDQALALATGDLLSTAQNIYVSALADSIKRIRVSDDGSRLMRALLEKNSPGFTNIKSFQRILTTSLAQDVMYIIWKESESIAAPCLSITEIGTEFDDSENRLTRNALKNLLCEKRKNTDPRVGDSMKRSIDRICDALEVFGLTERTTIRENLKPISGTAELNEIMTEVYCNVAEILFEQIDDGGDND
jgi:hypothetical protein